MANARAVMWRALPVFLLLALYWPGVTTWFYQDDFGWLNLRHDVHSVSDLPRALFAPKAHGNMRPLGENAYWLGIAAVFGADPLPFHVAAFLTLSASVLLLGAIVRRLTESAFAASAAQLLWMVNIGVAPSLGWSSIYNQVLSGFFLLLAFYFLLRFHETGRALDWAGQWAAFVLGLGALEINVVYPALAAVYALLFARPLVKRILPMFAVSAVAIGLHFHYAPAASSGVYAPRVDARVMDTAWTYWRWALGPMPVWLTIALTLAVCLLVAAAVRRGQYAALLGLAWFAIPLLPYLPLPEHRMDYYLAVPSIGVALLGAAAVAMTRESRAAWRVPTGVCLLVYIGASLPAALTVTRWQHARGARMEDLVLGVEAEHEAAPQKIVLLTGIDNDLFWSGVADLPFRAFGIPRVYLAPMASARIQAARELLSKYELPAALVRHSIQSGNAVLYRFDGERLHRLSGEGEGMPVEDEPHLVNLADDVFQGYFGAGWQKTAGGYRVMSGTASVRIGGPRNVSEQLYIGVFETRDFRLKVRANGVDLAVEPHQRGNDLSEFRATLPPASAGWKQMEVVLEANRAPLVFGYLEVR